MQPTFGSGVEHRMFLRVARMFALLCSLAAASIAIAAAEDSGKAVHEETTSEKLTGLEPLELRKELQEASSGDLWRRRAIILVTFLGIAMMGIVSLFQVGAVRSLPDPPIAGFDSNKVNSSDTAYRLGLPDGTLGVLTLAMNLPLAAVGGVARATVLPWAPLLFAGKALVDAYVGASYFYKMPVVEKAWCGYCIVGAVVNVTIFVLILPEAWHAVRGLFGG